MKSVIDQAAKGNVHNIVKALNDARKQDEAQRNDSIKLTRLELVNPNLKAAYSKLANAAVSGEVYYRLKKLGATLAQEKGEASALYMEMTKAYCNLDEAGNAKTVDSGWDVIAEKREDFEKANKDFVATIIDLKHLKFDRVVFKDFLLTSYEWELLDFMFLA